MHSWTKLWNSLLVFIIGMFSILSAYAATPPKFNMHYGVTPISKDIYSLHMIVLSVCAVIGIIVFSILIYSIISHRKSKNVTPEQFHEHPILEIVWAVIPLIILIVIAVPATFVLIRANDTKDANVTIKITGYQWNWEYEYLDQGINYFSNLKTPLEQIQNKEPKDKWYLMEVDKPLVVPIHEKIRFLLTSNDVIHSWWVPALGVKKDAVPGFINEAWARIEKPGIYRGQCAELCGVYHAFMPIVVKAVTKKEFKTWATEQREKELKEKIEPIKPTDIKQYAYKKLMELGRMNYRKYCAACHQLDGKGIAPVYPALRADSIAVKGSIKSHIDIVLKGVPGTSMQAFGRQLSDIEIASIITYERNAWGNNTKDVVQPVDVAKERESLRKLEHLKIKNGGE